MPYQNATVRHTEDGESVGPKMHKAVRYIARHGYAQSRNKVAKAVGPNGSQQYGYRSVNRCIRKGLLEIDPDHDGANPHGRGAVVLTEKGERYLEKH